MFEMCVRESGWADAKVYIREIGDGDKEEKKQFSLAPQKRIKGNMLRLKVRKEQQHMVAEPNSIRHGPAQRWDDEMEL